MVSCDTQVWQDSILLMMDLMLLLSTITAAAAGQDFLPSWKILKWRKATRLKEFTTDHQMEVVHLGSQY